MHTVSYEFNTLLLTTYYTCSCHKNFEIMLFLFYCFMLLNLTGIISGTPGYHAFGGFEHCVDGEKYYNKAIGCAELLKTIAVPPSDILQGFWKYKEHVYVPEWLKELLKNETDPLPVPAGKDSFQAFCHVWRQFKRCVNPVFDKCRPRMTSTMNMLWFLPDEYCDNLHLIIDEIECIQELLLSDRVLSCMTPALWNFNILDFGATLNMRSPALSAQLYRTINTCIIQEISRSNVCNSNLTTPVLTKIFQKEIEYVNSVLLLAKEVPLVTYKPGIQSDYTFIPVYDKLNDDEIKAAAPPVPCALLLTHKVFETIFPVYHEKYPISRQNPILRKELFEAFKNVWKQTQSCFAPNFKKYPKVFSAEWPSYGRILSRNFEEVLDNVVKIQRCVQGQDPIYPCFQGWFMPVGYTNLILSGRSIKLGEHDDPFLTNHVCDMIYPIMNCSSTVYKKISSECGRDAAEVLIDLTKLFVVNPEDIISSLTISGFNAWTSTLTTYNPIKIPTPQHPLLDYGFSLKRCGYEFKDLLHVFLD